MRHIALIAATLLASALAACTGGSSGYSEYHPGGTPRTFSRTDGDVTVTYDLLNTRYTAQRTITVSNDDAGATRAHVRLTADVGAITSSGTVANGYSIATLLTATAPTEAQAREALATMTVSHRDATDPGVLYLDTDISYARYEANNVSRDASMTAMLPSPLSYSLYQFAGVGSLDSSGLSGGDVTFDTGVGSHTLSGNFGTATLESGVGSIDVAVSHAAGSVYDLKGDTGTGSVTIMVAGTQPAGPQSDEHKHYQSANFASGNPQVRVSARTGTSSISIHD